MTSTVAVGMLAVMVKLAAAPRTDVPSPVVAGPRACTSVQGVEFWIRLSSGVNLRCVITDSVLQSHYGADGASAASWMAAFLHHRKDIERRALTAAGRRDDVHVVLINDASGNLKVAAGRCGR